MADRSKEHAPPRPRFKLPEAPGMPLENGAGSSGSGDAAPDGPKDTGQTAAGADGELSEISPVFHLSFGVDLTLDTPGEKIVIKYGKAHRKAFCGIPYSSATTIIPYYNLLWAEITNWGSLMLSYMVPATNAVTNLELTLRPSSIADATARALAARLRTLAYPAGTLNSPRAYVLVNPHAGRGRATRIWADEAEPIFRAARWTLETVETSFSGQAVTLVEQLDTSRIDVVVTCSGDGLAHEVFNGLARHPDARAALRRVAVAHVPCGSGNAMACNLYGTSQPALAALAIVKGKRARFDLVSVTQLEGGAGAVVDVKGKGKATDSGSGTTAGGGPEDATGPMPTGVLEGGGGVRRTMSFLSQSLGIVAESDLATEHLRWMGATRFQFGFLARVFKQPTYPCDIAVLTEIAHKGHVKQHYHREVSRAEPHSSARERIRKRIEADEAEDEAEMDEEDDGVVDFGEVNDVFREGDDVGLPRLKYGTVADPLPEGWQLVPYESLGTFYAGNMAYMATDTNFFPAALASDGLMDLVMLDGKLPAMHQIKLLLAVEKGAHFDQPVVEYTKVRAYRVLPRQTEGYLSIDGERLPFGAFQAEVHRGLATVISKKGDAKGGYESPGPSGWERTVHG